MTLRFVVAPQVIRLDQLLRATLLTHDRRSLENNPDWLELLQLYAATSKLLPEDYISRHGHIRIENLL